MKGYATTTYRFQEVTRQRRVTVQCSRCEKLRTRVLTVTHTINPYNRNDIGEPKSYSEVAECVMAELAKKAEAIADETIICKPCREEKKP